MGHNILIVDDNKDFADVFCDLLRSKTYKADSCYGGKQALSMLKDEDYDIFFVDIRMPEMDGIETLIEIKKKKPESTVIMMTGYSVDEMVHRALEENATDIIYKPFEVDKVISLIQGVK